MRALPPAIQGLVLDHLDFRDVLRATITDRAARKSLGAVRQVSRLSAHVLIMPDMVSKVGKCESLTIIADSVLVLERLPWALRALSNLRCVRIIFQNMTIRSSRWSQACEMLSRTMVDVTRIESFRVVCDRTIDMGIFRKYEALPSRMLEADAFHGVLFRLPLDCALATATDGAVPDEVVEKLIDRGANVNSIFHSSLGFPQSVLSRACLSQNTSAIKLLLEKGAQDSKLEKFDCFVYALTRDSKKVHVLRLLYDAGLKSWYRRDGQGGGLLHLAMCYCEEWDLEDELVDIVELVADRQPELTTLLDNFCHTPLSKMFMNCCEELDADVKVVVAQTLCECERDIRKLQTSSPH